MEVSNNINLSSYNTFGISANAKEFITINSINEIALSIDAKIFSQKHLIIGGGSNILLGGDYDGIVIKNNLKGKQVINEDDEFVWVKAAGGEIWHELVMFCVNLNLGGIENLSLIPGTVGAAPIQNIGAYGVELTDVFETLEAIDIVTGELKIFSKAECAFGYRTSVFKTNLKGKYFITAVTFKLSKHPIIKMQYGAIKDVLAAQQIDAPTIKDISNAVIAIRSSKLPDPKILGNAGSFFKNPEISNTHYNDLKLVYPEMPGFTTQNNLTKVPAGWLIEQCGWKGKRVGNTGAHKDQALVLVNYGNATGQEIIALAETIQQSVMDKFGIAIVPEVNLVN
ncbi:MAG: UDP-N-acetylmuramate dehydrogenase [Bacteroidetes bacterium]|nr:UDP-N-acetylmuramate dehydrogenase [Bacteroidota bacterium]